MGNFKITKEQIESIEYNLGNGNSKIVIQALKEWFPDAFKTELEVGKWYKNDDFPNLVYLEKILKQRNPKDLFATFATGYGFSFTDNPEWAEGLHFADSRNFYPATEEEVKSALIEEAKRRGFKRGIKIRRSESMIKICESSMLTVSDIGSNQFYYCIGIDILEIDSRCIYAKGEWATIIPSPKEMTVSDIEKELGYSVKIVK